MPAANDMPLTPVDFLARAAEIHPDKLAVVDGETRTSYGALWLRVRRLASALVSAGISPGDRVAVLAPNTGAMIEAHFGVPLAGAVLTAINVRLEPASVAFILRHSGARLLIVDSDCSALALAGLSRLEVRPMVVEVAEKPTIGGLSYETFLSASDHDFAGRWPDDEREPIALNYTSGTTGDPKGAVYTHRGAYLNALGNVINFGLDPTTVYLWTLPMFHCNGWTFAWAVTAVGGTHLCLRRFDARRVLELIADNRVTHLCGAPIVLTMLIEAARRESVRFDHRVRIATGGAPPPSAVIAAMTAMGCEITHLYGLTETYGPATLCLPQADWSTLTKEQRAQRMARQGVRHVAIGGLKVVDPVTRSELPCDGESVGEIVLRGNTIMDRYFENPDATAAAFRDGWFNTGDLAVRHPDGYLEIKDRAKDIIISGGENISSIEIEEVLYRHPAVLEAAVVARADPRWGETPCAFVRLRDSAESPSAADLIAWCRQHLAGFKVPKTILFGDLPKTATGKIQKFMLRARVNVTE